MPLLVFMFDRIGRIADETPFVVEWFVKSGRFNKRKHELYDLMVNEDEADADLETLRRGEVIKAIHGESAFTKALLSSLIRRIDVYRDYKLHIDFNIDFEQFSMGMDITSIAA